MRSSARRSICRLTALVISGPSARKAWLYGSLYFGVLSACTRPRTDIVATLTEDVGRYELVRTEVGTALVGHICVANPKHSDEIVARVIQQLSGQQFTAITVDVYSPREPIGRFVRGGGQDRLESLHARSNPCAVSR